MKGRIQFVFEKDAKRLLDQFSILFNVRIIFQDISHTRIHIGENKPICRFCMLIQKRLGLLETCINYDVMKFNEVRQKQSMISYNCHAGLFEAIYPVYIYGQTVGYIFMGQCRTSNQYSEEIKKRWKKKYSNSAELDRAFQQVTLLPKNKVTAIIQYLKILADYIVSHHLLKIKKYFQTESIVKYIEENIDKKITVDEVAKVVHRSKSTVSNMIRKVYNKSCKQLMIDTKLTRAGTLLINNRNMNISEVAASIGYDDVCYFSRIFKKYKKLSPTAFRKRKYIQ